MSEDHPTTDLARRFYLEPAAAFVRYTLPDVPTSTAWAWPTSARTW